jgi:hypothetical protein
MAGIVMDEAIQAIYLDLRRNGATWPGKPSCSDLISRPSRKRHSDCERVTAGRPGVPYLGIAEVHTCREPLRQHRRFPGMTSPAEAAKISVDIGRQQIVGQCERIRCQQELIRRQERDGFPDLVAGAVRFLGEMNETFAEMEAHYGAAQERLAHASVDEPSLAKVERDCPM